MKEKHLALLLDFLEGFLGLLKKMSSSIQLLEKSKTESVDHGSSWIITLPKTNSLHLNIGLKLSSKRKLNIVSLCHQFSGDTSVSDPVN